MAFSSVSVAFNRDKSSSFSSVSSNVLRHRRKYETTKNRYHQQFEQHYHHQNQHIQNRSRCSAQSFQKHDHYQSKINRDMKRKHSSCVWEEHRSSNGRIYYYNVVTDHSQWEKPIGKQILYRYKFANRQQRNSKQVRLI